MLTLYTMTVSLLIAKLGKGDVEPQQSMFQFQYKSHMIPHPDKAHRGGQDAYFDHEYMLVVADGVGGWNNKGIDPSKYSRYLCQKSGKLLSENMEKYLKDPLSVIIEAQSTNENVGSATMEVLTLTENTLRYCYIGGTNDSNKDSGFMIIRHYDQQLLSIYESVQQQHGFNFPFQLALPKYGGDDPRRSICGTIQVDQDDIVVVGSDGLFDNVSFQQVLKMVEEAQKEGNLLGTFAQQLSELAIKRGHDQNFNSPFAQRAKQQGRRFMGGKLDDTTVIVAKIITKLPGLEQL